MVKLWAAIGDAMSETGFNGGGGEGGGGGFGAFATPQAAKAELDKLYAKDFTDPKASLQRSPRSAARQWTDRVMKLDGQVDRAEKK
jgi:hypothetical protein